MLSLFWGFRLTIWNVNDADDQDALGEMDKF